MLILCKDLIQLLKKKNRMMNRCQILECEVFEDFRELNEENENLFEYVATEIVIHFIKFCIKGGS